MIAYADTPSQQARQFDADARRAMEERGKTDAVIQCKLYTHPVGYDAVKEAYSAKAIYKASAAFVVSNAAFTTQARRGDNIKYRPYVFTESGVTVTVVRSAQSRLANKLHAADFIPDIMARVP